MALSNTAIPKYYGAFRERVLMGEIPVCKEISMQMNLIDNLISDPRFFYDSNAIDGFISFCENEMTLTDGSDLILLDTFKLWAEDLLSWFYYEETSVWEGIPGTNHGHFVKKKRKRRLRHKQFLIVGRGAAKTLYNSLIHSYGLAVELTTTQQISTAPTMRQAEETLEPIKTALSRSKGPLFKFLTEGSIQNTTGSKANRVKLTATKKGIQNFITNSTLEVRPMSIDKLQGARPYISTVDEWLSGTTREDPIGALEQGAAKVDDWLIIATSSEGTVRNGIGDTIKMELMDILKGEYAAPHYSIWYYRLDSKEEVEYPELWMKAQPNIGLTVSYETYQQEVERAKHNPSARNDVLAKRFGIPCEGLTYYFTYEETLPHRTQDFYGMPCAMGCDLSRGDDFCAFTFLFPLQNGCFGVKSIAYISTRTYLRIPTAMQVKYEEFIKEGTLVVLEGNVIDMMDVYDDLDKYIISNAYDVIAVGYDPYNAKEFIDRWVNENGPFGIVKVIQGAKTESVPLGELKQLSESRSLLFDQSIMSFTMGNAVVSEDTNGNRKLYKTRHDQKIDNVAALMDAYVSYKSNKELFV